MSGRPEECVSSPERTAAVLAVSPLPAERDRLQKILSQENWQLYEASDCCEALALLRDQSVPVLLCERDHADGNWEELLNTTASLPAPPNLIVFSRLADESSGRRCAGGNATLVRAPSKKRRLRTAQLYPLGKCCRTARSDGRDLNVGS